METEFSLHKINLGYILNVLLKLHQSAFQYSVKTAHVDGLTQTCTEDNTFIYLRRDNFTSYLL